MTTSFTLCRLHQTILFRSSPVWQRGSLDRPHFHYSHSTEEEEGGGGGGGGGAEEEEEEEGEE